MNRKRTWINIHLHINSVPLSLCLSLAILDSFFFLFYLKHGRVRPLSASFFFCLSFKPFTSFYFFFLGFGYKQETNLSRILRQGPSFVFVQHFLDLSSGREGYWFFQRICRSHLYAGVIIALVDERWLATNRQ